MNLHLRHIEQVKRFAVIVHSLGVEAIGCVTWLKQLQLFTLEEAVLEGEHGCTVLAAVDRHTHDLIIADILAVAVVLTVGRRTEVKACVILPMADLVYFIKAELRHDIALRIGKISIGRRAVCAGHAGRVIRGLVAALDFEGIDASLDKLRNVLDHAHILGIIQIGAAAVLLDREKFAGTLFLHQGVIPAAGLCTRAVVCITAGHVLRNQAAAGIGNAHCAVDKGLDFQRFWRFGTDFSDLLKRELACEDDAFSAHVRPEVCSLGIENAGLGRDVHRNLGRVSARHAKHAYIRDDECVRACVLQQLQIGRKRRKVSVGRHNIDCNVALDAVRMRVGNALAQRIIVKVGCSGTHAEARSGHIDRIRAVGNAKPHFVQIACGRQ